MDRLDLRRERHKFHTFMQLTGRYDLEADDRVVRSSYTHVVVKTPSKSPSKEGTRRR